MNINIDKLISEMEDRKKSHKECIDWCTSPDLKWYWVGRKDECDFFIHELIALKNEQPEAITEGSHLCKHDVGGSTANEETTSLVNDQSDTSSETQAVGGNKQTKEPCLHKESYYVGTVANEWCPQCKKWLL